VLHHLCCLSRVISLLALSFSEHSQVWSPWKYSLYPYDLVCDVFVEQYESI
jgi:hypothetical protein